MPISRFLPRAAFPGLVDLGIIATAGALPLQETRAHATCAPPNMAKILGQEDLVDVWTPGAEGLCDGRHKPVTAPKRDSEPTLAQTR